MSIAYQEAVHYPTTPSPPLPPPPSAASNSSKWGPYSSAGEFSASMVVILAGLFCAFLIAGSLGAAVHYLLCGHRRGRRQPASREDDDPEKQTEDVATRVSAFVVLVFSAAGGGGGSGRKQQQQLRLAGDGAECAICLTEFVDGDAVGVLPACNHGFHVRCVERWLAGRSSCPTCRAHCDVVGGSGPEEKELRG